MSKRISHSLLDPWLTLPVKKFYPLLPLPRRLPPEAIVLLGHLFAIAAALGFAFSTQYWWGGLVIAIGVAANHIADVIDGTHARATGQCRNGGELLDHFTDPLSFAYYVVGLAVSIGRLDLGIAGVIILFATAVLTNIKAKMIGEFTLATFGPTEFKTLLVVYGLALTALTFQPIPNLPPQRFALWFMYALLAVGLVQLIVNLIRAVIDVNRRGTEADKTEWETTRDLPADK
jgi:phosphatidylglycerophosphate synthase